MSYLHRKKPAQYETDFTIENPLLQHLNPDRPPYYWVSHPLVRHIQQVGYGWISPMRVARFVWNGKPLPEYPVKNEDVFMYQCFLAEIFREVKSLIDLKMKNRIDQIVWYANLDPLYPNTDDEPMPENYKVILRQLIYLFDKMKIKHEDMEKCRRIGTVNHIAREYWHWQHIVHRALNAINFLGIVHQLKYDALDFGYLKYPKVVDEHSIFIPLKSKLGKAREFEGTLSHVIKDDWHFEHVQKSLVDYMGASAPKTLEEADTAWIWWDMNDPEKDLSGLYGEKDTEIALDEANISEILSLFAEKFGTPNVGLTQSYKIENEFNLDIYHAEAYEHKLCGTNNVFLVYVRHEWRTQPNPGYFLVFPRDIEVVERAEDDDDIIVTPNDLYEKILDRLDGYPVLDDEAFSSLEWTYALEELAKTIENEVSDEARELYEQYEMDARELEENGLCDDWVSLALDPRYTLSHNYVDLEEAIIACAISKGYNAPVKVYDCGEQEWVPLQEITQHYIVMITEWKNAFRFDMEELLEKDTIVKSWSFERDYDEEDPDPRYSDEYDFKPVLEHIQTFTTGKDTTYGEFKVRVGNIPEDLKLETPFIVADSDTHQLLVMKM